MAGGDGGGRWVCLDVGETLVDETRVWAVWADVLGVPRLTLGAALGAALARGGDGSEAFAIVGATRWHERADEVEAAYGGFRRQDLYADALPALDALRAADYRVAVVGNQPAVRHAQLEALGVRADAMAMSQALGAAKPDPAFFARTLELLGRPDPATVAYVGDRVDNDVVPAARAGLRAVWLRRGPWGLVQSGGQERAALVVRSLDELVARLDEAFT